MLITALSLACAGCAPMPDPEPLDGATCSVTDGDTIRCGDERIRLLGIDAPETNGCRPGRTCVAGDGAAATRALVSAVQQGPLSVVRVGTDRYGRTLGVVFAGSTNLSCAMLAAGQAEYVARWDNGRLIARDCPELVQ